MQGGLLGRGSSSDLLPPPALLLIGQTGSWLDVSLIYFNDMIAAVNSSMLLPYTQYLHFALLLFFFFFFFLCCFNKSKFLFPAIFSWVFLPPFSYKFVTMTEYVPRNKQRISPCFHNKPRRVGPSALLHDHCLLRLTRERERRTRDFPHLEIRALRIFTIAENRTGNRNTKSGNEENQRARNLLTILHDFIKEGKKKYRKNERKKKRHVRWIKLQKKKEPCMNSQFASWTTQERGAEALMEAVDVGVSREWSVLLF